MGGVRHAHCMRGLDSSHRPPYEIEKECRQSPTVVAPHELRMRKSSHNPQTLQGQLPVLWGVRAPCRLSPTECCGRMPE